MKERILGLIISSIVCLFIGVIVQNTINTHRTNIHYNTAVVQSVGQCNKNECSFTVKTEFGSTEHMMSSEPVSVGQTVYQECWTEKVRGDRCYVNYSPQK